MVDLREGVVVVGERDEISPAFLRKLEKSVLIWRKNALIVVIYGYNFLFKMKFLRVSRGKNRRTILRGQSALIRRKLCLKKFLVTHLAN